MSSILVGKSIENEAEAYCVKAVVRLLLGGDPNLTAHPPSLGIITPYVFSLFLSLSLFLSPMMMEIGVGAL